ncbi:hypothetical protein N7510_011193 [Penicillium lagena]|uniref:uncharacterized protein n=1 Tax=Penicillium lagena TaxID=94218 RepID=UPI002541A2FA|nr:uncharacterized protein N7510_011193 [Penicillium lagena]KAJ5601659.1 hypothetical protein N7510_011193 [Penicillium lagena]
MSRPPPRGRAPSPVGLDPALDRPPKPTLKTDLVINVDLPYTAYKINSPTGEFGLLPALRRPGYNTTGKEVDILVNAYPILKWPTKPVYQYEVNVVQGRILADDRRVHRKVWHSNERKAKLPDAIFDGFKIAWSLTDYKDFNEVILDIKGGVTRPLETQHDEGFAPESFRLSLRRNRKIDLSVINAWLEGKHDTDEHVLEAFNFLDHLLRSWPNDRFVGIKRSYFFDKLSEEDENRFTMDLCNMGCSVMRGIYQAIRPSPKGLMLNVDVSHAVFFSRISLMGIMRGLYELRDPQQLMALLKPIADGYGGIKESPSFIAINKRIKGLRVMPNYDGCPFKEKGFMIDNMMNANPREYLLDIQDRATGEVERISVEKYFLKKYNVYLRYPMMPLIKMTKKNCIYPAEFLVIKGLQRYRYKLNEDQTAQMIKFCATKPSKRLADIRECKSLLQHDNDPVLRMYDMKIGTSMLKVKARILPNPELRFGANGKHNPGTSGRWDLRGKKFYTPNSQPLKSWGVGFFTGKRNAINTDQTLRFIDNLMKIYAGHGGQIVTRPQVAELNEDIGHAIKKLYDQTQMKFKQLPQLLVIIVPNKDSFVYLRIKKSCDCRFGVPSQVLQAGHCINNRPQYISNVLMKVNAKLGGTTARAQSRLQDTTLRPHSMIVGADVTHPMIGVWTPSLAAMTVSADQFGSRYMGACECNGDRVEIIHEGNVTFLLEPLIREWVTTVGQGRPPKNIYYFRDGVSQSEFSKVLEEAKHIKLVIAKVCNTTLFEGKMTVVIANKRHHLRAFPNPSDQSSADRNGNPLPGTLIERDVTSPHDWDFLLYAHIALQGTSRPVHYHVILDEMKHKPHELENMIYDHSYQYIRSTTSVSIHPAVYYAHLIAARARHHEDVPASSGPQSGPTVKMTNPKPRDRPATPKLLPIQGSDNRLALRMWYI